MYQRLIQPRQSGGAFRRYQLNDKLVQKRLDEIYQAEDDLGVLIGTQLFCHFQANGTLYFDGCYKTGKADNSLLCTNLALWSIELACDHFDIREERGYTTKLILSIWTFAKIDQSSTGSTPAFKPVVVAAINLYQLASTRPPVTRLMNFRRALSARDPDSGFYHEASDSFLAKNQTVNFLQIFQRQRGAKITVVLPDYTECLIYQ